MKLFTITRLALICTLLTTTTSCASWRLNGNPNTDPNVNFLGTTDSKALVVKTNNQEAMRISSSGMVGIGTATPARRLHVNEDNANSYVRISNNHRTGGANSILQFFEGSTQQAALIARGSGIAGGPPNALNIYTYVSGAPITLGTASGEAIRITDNGNVGIGTKTPARRLHVNEDNANSYVRISNNHRTGGANSILQFFEGSTQQAALIARGSGIAGGPPNALNIYTYVSGAPITLGTASGEAIRITDSGNVGIGTKTPAGALDVNGAIYQRGSALHADYVFEQDYALESIEEHAAFMWANKHLAAIPAAVTDKNGLEVIEMGAYQRGIVEELEKAHIYIEQLSRNNSELERKNRELEERLVKLELLLGKRD